MKVLATAIGVAAAALLAALFVVFFRPDGTALVGILADQCGLQQGVREIREPCLKVDHDLGYALIRDRKGPHHFLLLPTEPISGIESPQLLDPSTPNYFWLAWQNRDLVAAGLPEAAKPDVMLAVNSRYGRSQSRLHIHLSCTAPEVRAVLDRIPEDQSGWQVVSDALSSNTYWVLKVQPQELQGLGAFRLLAERFPVSAAAMATHSLALTTSRDGGFLLLATQVSITDLNLASSGELLDHTCMSARRASVAPGASEFGKLLPAFGRSLPDTHG